MSETASERRMVENEIVFRDYNEQIKKGIDAVNKIAAEESQHPMEINGSEPLFFYCECSDENCTQRVRVSPDAYNKIHEARNKFVIIRGHEVLQIEDVVSVEPNYSIVAKHVLPSQTPSGLHHTDVHNV